MSDDRNQPPHEPDHPVAELPHARTILVISGVILASFGAVTAYVLASPHIDPATKGAMIQTWNNLAIAVGTFWLGSSLGGKMRRP